MAELTMYSIDQKPKLNKPSGNYNYSSNIKKAASVASVKAQAMEKFDLIDERIKSDQKEIMSNAELLKEAWGKSYITTEANPNGLNFVHVEDIEGHFNSAVNGIAKEKEKCSEFFDEMQGKIDEINAWLDDLSKKNEERNTILADLNTNQTALYNMSEEEKKNNPTKVNSLSHNIRVAKDSLEKYKPIDDPFSYGDWVVGS